MNLSDHSSIGAVHRFHVQAFMLSVGATMVYFLVKRKRFAWIYEMVTAAILCNVLFHQFRLPSLHFTETAIIFLYATIVGLLCGFLPATLRWFWRHQKSKQSEEERLIRNMEMANGATGAAVLSPSTMPYRADDVAVEALKPVWTMWKSLGLILMIALTILATWLVIHSLNDGRASYRGQIADIHADPKHYWFSVVSNFFTARQFIPQRSRCGKSGERVSRSSIQRER